MNPYNHNPFKTDTARIKNETDANRALRRTLVDIAQARCPEDTFHWHEIREDWIRERDRLESIEADLEEARDLDPWNEWGTHDELRKEELERIEAQKEEEELQHNGYWD